MNCNFFGASPYYYKDLEEMNYELHELHECSERIWQPRLRISTNMLWNQFVNIRSLATKILKINSLYSCNS